MRILMAILIFVLGCALIVYSFTAPYVGLAAEFDRAQSAEEASGALIEFLRLFVEGEIPQVSGFLYGGALALAVSVVVLFAWPAARSDKKQ